MTFYLLLTIGLMAGCNSGDVVVGDPAPLPPPVTSGWPQQWGTPDEDRGNGVGVDNAGHILVVGTTWGNLDGISQAGNGDIFLTQYGAAGNRLWTRLLGTASPDEGHALVIDNDNAIYVTGSAEDGIGSVAGYGREDIALASYDASGGIVWANVIGSSQFDMAFDIAIDPRTLVGDKDFYITGVTYGDWVGSNNQGGADALLAKYCTCGGLKWVETLGSSVDDIGHGVAVDSNGNIYVVGQTEGTLDGTINSGATDAFLAKYDDLADVVWIRQFGTQSADVAQAVAVDSAGNLYVTGSTAGVLDTTAGLVDAFLAKFDASGNQLWVKQFGSANDDAGINIAIDSSSNIYVAGTTWGDLDGNTSAGGVDVFLAKYDSAGTKQWTRQAGTALDDHATALAIEGNQHIYLTGYTQGDLAAPTAGMNDIFLLKYDASGTPQ